MKAKLQKIFTPQFIKYAIIGAITQLIDLGTYAILVNLGVNYIIADLINTPLALGFNYLGHKYITFDQKIWSYKEIGKYAANIFWNYVYSTLILFIAVGLLHLHPVVAKLVQIAAMIFTNYVVLKLFVFKTK